MIFNETFPGFVILLLSSLIIGKFFNPSLGNVILSGAVLYAFSAAFFGFFTIFLANIAATDENMKMIKPEKDAGSDENAKNYLVYFAIIFVVFWIVMFLIFPENTIIGDLIRK